MIDEAPRQSGSNDGNNPDRFNAHRMGVVDSGQQCGQAVLDIGVDERAAV
jgi:hypothetical protein